MGLLENIKSMDLTEGGKSVRGAHKDQEGVVFAWHALAVIRVHDSQEAQDRKLKLRDICAADGYLKDVSEMLVSYLFRAFGRHCIPVFEAFLSNWYAADVVEKNLSSIESELRRTLGLNSVVGK